MLGCSILNTFMTCLHVITCSASGQLHCGYSYDGAWVVHTLGVWLMDVTNAMSSPSWHNKTLELGISQALNINEATIPSFFCFHIPEKLALHTILVVSNNISNKMENQLIHYTSSKLFFGRKKDSFHVVMEWFHSHIGVLPYNVAIANTPHCHLVCPWYLRYVMNQNALG
jgi:hypothetical protein